MKLLIDSNYLAHRAFFVTGDLSYKEQKTGVIFTFLMQCLKLAKRFDTTDLIFCWDSKKSYRKILYPEYKSNRRKDLSEDEKKKYQMAYNQFDILKNEALFNLGFSNVFYRIGYEADDLIAIITKNNLNDEFVIVSSDNDLYQLLTSKVKMFDVKKKELFTNEDFESKFNILSSQWAMAKSISGCNTDGVKGIRGISDPGHNEKSKVFLYLKGKLQGKLFKDIDCFAGQQLINRNKQLIDLPLVWKDAIDIELKENTFIKKKFIDVFSQYDFRSCLDNFKQWEIFF